ncbi:hypothetical protein CLV62_12524 [Dysgonomonas alginatilytica]|uniref:Uncharacterized protein n=1 Tax=Dysgonomonas alginatilytica TaxID=1605892 RepID=A0A2V3PKX9_9BACT|nr:hypothetical protein CLV62_12524 [Dysgonomonas alginatilytica]
MAKKIKQCSSCIFWIGKDPDRNLCSEIRVGTDVFISGRYLQTTSSFGCYKYKEKEVKDDSISDTDAASSSGD